MAVPPHSLPYRCIDLQLLRQITASDHFVCSNTTLKTPLDRFRSLVPNAGRIVSLVSANQSAPWERRRCFSDKDMSKVYTLIIASWVDGGLMEIWQCNGRRAIALGKMP